MTGDNAAASGTTAAPEPAAADPWVVPGVAASAPPPGPYGGQVAGGQAGAWYANPYAAFGPGAGAPVPVPVPGTNGFAITSLVSALVCGVWPLAIGFGIGALVQLRKRRQSGRGLAVAGLVLGTLELLATVVMVIITVSLPDPSASATGTVSVFTLHQGDCFNTTSSFSEIRALPVSCWNPHTGEVAALVPLGNGVFPGTDEVEAAAAVSCRLTTDTYVTDLWAQSPEVIPSYFAPQDAQSWAVSPQAVCYLRESDTAISKPLRLDSSNLTSDQIAFLAAVHDLDHAARSKPTGSTRTDSQSYRNWILDNSVALDNATTALAAHTWPDYAKPQVADLLAELRAEQPAWWAATRDTGTPLDTLVAQLTARSPNDTERAARRSLSLTDQDYVRSTAPAAPAGAAMSGAPTVT